MSVASEKEKMLAGQLYRADDPELKAEQRRCHALVRAFNHEEDEAARAALLRELLGGFGEGAEIRPPLACDFGYNVTLGAGAFVNFGAVILDCAPVAIGDRAQIGPSVQLLAADHPRELAPRREGLECAAPVTLGADTWLGGGVIVCPGVTVGAGSVIGAGSVVIRDVPAGVVAAGNPCRVVREL